MSDDFSLDVDQGACYGVNATAARVLLMLDRPQRLSDIRKELVREFDVDEDACNAELRGLLIELEKKRTGWSRASRLPYDGWS